jgi:hypothetical protein
MSRWVALQDLSLECRGERAGGVSKSTGAAYDHRRQLPFGVPRQWSVVIDACRAGRPIVDEQVPR